MAPALRNLDSIPLIESFIKLIPPVSLIFFNTFFAIFEGILNCYAEIAKFGDRQFYLDFWNSTNFDDWARKWNRPVHGFLKEYLYAYILSKFHCSPIRGYLCTIVASAILHEFVLVFFN